MTKLFTFSEEEEKDWICLATIRNILPIGSIDIFEYGGKSYKVERVIYKVEQEILEVYLYSKMQ